MSDVSRSSVSALWRHRRLLARGYHKLVTVFTVLLLVVLVVAKGFHFLWTAPVRDITEPADDEAAPHQRVQRSEWTREIVARTDMARKYGVYNQRLDSMVERGEVARGVADDARRDAGVFDPVNDSWRRTPSASHLRSAASAFNPVVTLTGL